MAQVASPYGLRPVQLLGGLPFAGAIRSYPLNTNSATPFYYGAAVALVGGQIQTLTASPTTAAGPNTPIGVFLGAEWQDPIRGFVNSQWIPPNLITGGATQVKAKILDYPDTIWKIQANGPVQAVSLGLNVPLVGIGNGNTATGDSQVGCDAAAAATATFALRIVGFPNVPGSTPGDPFTDLLVMWNFGVHRYKNSLGM